MGVGCSVRSSHFCLGDWQQVCQGGGAGGGGPEGEVRHLAEEQEGALRPGPQPGGGDSR